MSRDEMLRRATRVKPKPRLPPELQALALRQNFARQRNKLNLHGGVEVGEGKIKGKIGHKGKVGEVEVSVEIDREGMTPSVEGKINTKKGPVGGKVTGPKIKWPRRRR